MNKNHLMLFNRFGATTERYTTTQRDAMREHAWQMHRDNKGPIQVWRATEQGTPIGYDGPTTRHLSEWMRKKAEAELILTKNDAPIAFENSDVERLCDHIDAHVFIDGTFHNLNDRAWFRWFIERWHRELDAIEAEEAHNALMRHGDDE